MGSGIVPIEGAIVWLFAHSMEGAMITLSAWVNDAISSSEVLPVYEVKSTTGSYLGVSIRKV